MRAQQFHARNLRIDGPWKWILTEFADYYGVSDSYTKLRLVLIHHEFHLQYPAFEF